MNFTLGFSPCPNDTFIFNALVNNKLETGGLTFEAVLEDVETLNSMALEGKLDFTKLSYGVLPLVLNEYVLLNSGSALGSGVGPLLICRDAGQIPDIEESVIAIPGKNTTAHMLFSLAYPAAKKKEFMRYDEIENFVIGNKGLGVIIHENRFTYHLRGLHKIRDLGDHWEQQTGNPIPLGGIVARRGIGLEVQQQADRLIRESIQYAFGEYPRLDNFIRANAQEMNEDVMRSHIRLYVNDFSLDLGDKGRNAVRKFIDVFNQVNGTGFPSEGIFVPQD